MVLLLALFWLIAFLANA